MVLLVRAKSMTKQVIGRDKEVTATVLLNGHYVPVKRPSKCLNLQITAAVGLSYSCRQTSFLRWVY